MRRPTPPGWTVRLVAWGPVARHVAATRRALGLRFTRWAAGIALFAYLSLFPLATLAFVVFSQLLKEFPELRDAVQTAIADALPGLLGTSGEVSVDLSQSAAASASDGVIGLVLLLVAGLGWVDAVLEGVRRMMGVLRRPRNFVLLSIEDALWLIVLGTILLAALIVTVGTRTAGDRVFTALGMENLDAVWATAWTNLLVVLLVATTLVLVYGYAWRRPGRRWRAVVQAALLVGLAIGVMGAFAYVIVGPTLDNPVYGTLAVAAALLVLLYLASATVLYGACWVAVLEGRPEPAEVTAYFARLRSSSEPWLPLTSAPDHREEHDSGDERGPG